MSKPKTDGERLSSLMTAMAEYVADLSDREILADSTARGADIHAEAQHVRDVLLAGIVKAKKQRLQRAQNQHREAAESFHNWGIGFPRDPSARRELLGRVLTSKPQLREAVMTLQHRNFESFSDTDVEHMLRQLQYLGALDDDEPGPKS